MTPDPTTRRPLLAFSTLAFPFEPLGEVAAFGRDLGYEGIELRVIDGELIDPGVLDAAGRQRIKRALGGLPVVAVDSSVRLTGEAPGRAIAAFLQLAHDWGSPVVRVFGGALPPERETARREAALGEAALALEGSVPTAERLGVSIGVETHDDFSSSAQIAELLALVPSGAVGAVWDSHHPHRMGETPDEVWSNLGERLVLAQVKDARRSAAEPSGWELVLLGRGEVPVREMLGVLDAHGYAGAVSVEWEKKWHPGIPEAAVALPQHLELLRAWIGELGATGAGPGAGAGAGAEAGAAAGAAAGPARQAGS